MHDRYPYLQTITKGSPRASSLSSTSTNCARTELASRMPPSDDRAGGGGIELGTGDRTRVLLAVTSTDTGGTEAVVRELATRLDPSRIDCRVCSLLPLGRLGAAVAASGVPAFSLSMGEGAGPLQTTVACLRLARYVARHQIDVIMGFLYRGNTLAALAGRIAGRGVKIAVNQRSLPPLGRALTGVGSRLTWPLADAIVAVSEAVRDHLVGAERVRRERVRVIHNGVDTERFAPGEGSDLRRSLGIDTEAVVYGAASRLTRVKGLDYLLLAFERVAAANPNVHLVVAGDGPERTRLDGLVAELGLAQRVHFLGNRDDMAVVYPAFDVFVLSSLREGLPNVVLEAMACGCPVVATDVGGVGEILTKGKGGVLIPAENTERLAAAMVDMIPEESRRRLSVEARAHVQADWNVSQMVRQYEEFLLDLAGRRG